MTKKALVRFDAKHPERRSSDFLAAIRDDDGTFALRSLKSGRVAKYGLVVYAGRTVTPDDVVSRLVTSGHRIKPGDETRRGIEAFVEQLPSFNIGQVLELVATEDIPCGIRISGNGSQGLSARNPPSPLSALSERSMFPRSSETCIPSATPAAACTHVHSKMLN